MVTLVGREILRGRHISVGGVTPRDWLHFIGQLGDINYLRKLPALFNEFRETGMSDKLDEVLRATYPDFFWKTVRPYIGDALRYLRITQEGKQWVSKLYANVFSMEHRSQTL